ncbi:hypothetical protein [Ochrobactrum teleogrylli]
MIALALATPSFAQEKVLGVAAIDLQNSFYVRMKEAGDVAASDYGVKSTWQSAEGSLEKQVGIIENFINQGVSAISHRPYRQECGPPGDQEGAGRQDTSHHHGQQGGWRRQLFDALSRL